MKKKVNLYRTWNEFINFKGKHSEKMQILRDSTLILGSPGTMRQLVWVALIDPDYAGTCLEFYRKTPPGFLLTRELEEKIKSLVEKPFPEIILELYNAESTTFILRIFALKRSDIGVCYGMQFIAALVSALFIVQTDAFIMFCYIYENLYPSEFFLTKNRSIGLHQELRIFALMAEMMRPKLLNNLKAIYSSQNTKEVDSSPFVTLMKNISEIWFKTLFSTVFPLKTLVRVFDNFLIFGFEFIHKFGLAYLSKKEKFIINSIKTETKGLKLGASIDALIIAGNLTKSKLLCKSDTFDVEPLIKKCIKKESYINLKRFDFLSKAVILESKSSERISRLQKAKSLLNEFPLTAFTAFQIIKAFTSKIISRKEFNEFTQQIASWSPYISNSIFTVFDEKGEEEVEKEKLSVGIALLVTDSLEEKLRLCFRVFDSDNSNCLSGAELSVMIVFIESALDGRSTFYQKESQHLMKIIDANNDSKISIEEFIQTVKTQKIFKPVIDYLNLLDSQNLTEIDHEHYEEIHSPNDDLSENVSESDNLIENISDPTENEEKIPQFTENNQLIVESELVKVLENFLEKQDSGNKIAENESNAEKKQSEENVLDFSSQSISSLPKENKLFKHTTNRSESTVLGLVTNDLESMSAEHLIDFPENDENSKIRNCDRLCSKESCRVI